MSVVKNMTTAAETDRENLPWHARSVSSALSSGLGGAFTAIIVPIFVFPELIKYLRGGHRVVATTPAQAVARRDG